MIYVCCKKVKGIKEWKMTHHLLWIIGGTPKTNMEHLPLSSSLFQFILEGTYNLLIFVYFWNHQAHQCDPNLIKYDLRSLRQANIPLLKIWRFGFSTPGTSSGYGLRTPQFSIFGLPQVVKVSSLAKLVDIFWSQRYQVKDTDILFP